MNELAWVLIKDRSVIELKSETLRGTYESMDEIQSKIRSEQKTRESLIEEMKANELRIVELEQKINIIKERIKDRYDTEVPKDPNEQIAKLESLGSKLSDYTSSPEIKAELEAAVQELNKKFSNPEQVKKFTILPRDLNVDEGELTPTLKIRRKQINENWAKEIEAMYSE